MNCNRKTDMPPVQYGLEPVYSPQCTHLILGSFPSVMSRGYFYYGNPRNRLWDVIGKILGNKAPELPHDKIDYLLRHKLAMWDIVAYCNIKGSGDADIKIRDINQINDIPSLISGGNIRRILCNGGKSYSLFNRYFAGKVDAEVVLLPSTSPANFKFDINMWKAALSDL